MQLLRVLKWRKGAAGPAENAVVRRILAHAECCAGGSFLTLIEAGGVERSVSYAALVSSAHKWTRRYRNAGLTPGAIVIVVLEHGEALYAAYIGALLGGYCPAYFAHPSDKVDSARYRAALEHLLQTVGAEAIVTSRTICERFEGGLEATAILLDDDSLIAPRTAPVRGRRRTLEGALFLQFSSGTTGAKKGVPITAAMLLRQVDAYAREIRVADGDRIVSWLPLYHDMGLIACFLLPLLEAIPIIAMSPFDWVKRPALLLEAITRHRGTLVWLPNFAYSFIALRAAPRPGDAWDIASVRALVNCSEPIQHRSHVALLERLAPCGLRESALASSYALAENTFAVTSGGIERPLVVESIDGARLAPGDCVVSAAPSAESARTVVSSGRPLASTHVAIVDGEGRALPDGTLGEIEIGSPSLFSGYVAADAETRSPHDGRYRTGDLGYLRGGELFVIGRLSDTIIVGGRNVHPQDVEAVVDGVPGVIPGRCVAIGVPDDALGTQRLVIVAETHVADADGRRALRAQIRDAVAGAVDIVPGDVALVEHMWLEKSTSGKPSRSANRRRYLAAQAGRVKPDDRVQDAPTTAEAVRACIIATLRASALREVPDFDADTDLLRSVIDSFSLVALQLSLEDRFGAERVRTLRETPERFRTVRTIAALLDGATPNEGAALNVPGGAEEGGEARKYRLAPQLLDVEAQPYEWVAYLMRRGAPNYRSASLNSDAQGYRVTYRGDAPIAFSGASLTANALAVTLGNSFAYGIGTTHDARTFTSLLNARAETNRFVWCNLAQRASVLTQERLAFELHAPSGTQSVVWVSGVNNLISLIVGEGHPDNPVPFVGERQYAARMMPGVRLATPPALEHRYGAMIRQIEVDLSAVALRMRGRGRVVFCLQPSASWIEKSWTSEELELIAIFDDAGSVLQQAHHPRHLAPLHARFAGDLAAICARWGIDFIDSNLHEGMRERRWLFIDRTHMTDAGHELLAGLLAQHLVQRGTQRSNA